MLSQHSKPDPFGAVSEIDTRTGKVRYYSLASLERAGLTRLDRLPFSIRILLESLLRNVDGFQVTEQDVRQLAGWRAESPDEVEIPFKPGRVILQDFTGVPSVVDLAALRGVMQRLGGDPKKINPQVRCDLVIDHSVQTDAFASPEALEINKAKEFERNTERYALLKWAQQAFDNFRVVPPATGIIHQVNLEHLAQVVLTQVEPGRSEPTAFPDSLVGTDSHTTMINGLGVVGWGVGGIEAEAVMLGQPISMLTPRVVGFRLVGELPEGATATDLVLTITQILRNHGVVGKFVEFFGPGLSALSLPDRATVANMGPEYGATVGFFPVDDETLAYLRLTGRPAAVVELVEKYCKAQGLFRTADTPDPLYSETLELDMSTVEPCLAGPKRPQDRVRLADAQESFRTSLTAPIQERGFALPAEQVTRRATVAGDENATEIGHGVVAIASITSCTNTSNPSVMLGAGLLAKKAVEKGLRVPPYVKTSLAPGSRVVTDYLVRAGLMDALERIGFHVVGYGCLTCIGNSGPLPEPVAAAIANNDLVACSVLSGNRNFEGRVNPLTRANYLASPPLVVAYALAGTTDIDLTRHPIGCDSQGREVYLKDIWPTQEEVRQALVDGIAPEQFEDRYAHAFEGEEQWQAIPTAGGELFDWNDRSTYIQEPPFFTEMKVEPDPIGPIRTARCLVMVGDSVTTDHISPAGAIAAESPAGRYLQAHGVAPADFNSYGSRRGNDRVMIRGTFANIRLRNLLAPGTEGGVTIHLPTGSTMSIHEAAELYKQEGTPLVVLAGKEYGTGSSRDWAAKGTSLLGVRAVVAESFERIHRSNLVGMGVLPLEYSAGQTRTSLGLDGTEEFDIVVDDSLQPRQKVSVAARRANGTTITFETLCRIDTPVELEYYRNGGILQTVLRKMLKD